MWVYALDFDMSVNTKNQLFISVTGEDNKQRKTQMRAILNLSHIMRALVIPALTSFQCIIWISFFSQIYFTTFRMRIIQNTHTLHQINFISIAVLAQEVVKKNYNN